MELVQLVSNENQQASIFYFENDTYKVLYKRSNNTSFSVEHQKFPERKIFHLKCE